MPPWWLAAVWLLHHSPSVTAGVGSYQKPFSPPYSNLLKEKHLDFRVQVVFAAIYTFPPGGSLTDFARNSRLTD